MPVLDTSGGISGCKLSLSLSSGGGDDAFGSLLAVLDNTLDAIVIDDEEDTFDKRSDDEPVEEDGTSMDGVFALTGDGMAT